jgi:hypothetical protein
MIEFRYQGVGFQIQSGADYKDVEVGKAVAAVESTGGKNKAHIVTVARVGRRCPIKIFITIYSPFLPELFRQFSHIDLYVDNYAIRLLPRVDNASPLSRVWMTAALPHLAASRILTSPVNASPWPCIQFTFIFSEIPLGHQPSLQNRCYLS